MKFSLVVALVVSTCTPVSVGASERQSNILALDVQLSNTQEVLKDLKTTLNRTNDTLSGVGITLTNIQNRIDTHTEKIKELERSVTIHDGRVAALEVEKKKLNIILTFIGYLLTALVVVLGFFKKSQIRSFLTGSK